MTATLRVDLHCHSTVSDGELSPERVAGALVEAGVRAAALTDHESLAGQGRFCSVLQRQGIECISGAELEVQTNQGSLHLLAYGFDPGDQTFLKALKALRSPLWSWACSWVDYVFTGIAAGRNGSAPAVKRAYPAPLSSGTTGLSDAIALIHAAGGCAFLAHPLTSVSSLERLDELLEELCKEGLDGIEAFYKPYPLDIQNALLGLSQQHGLLVSAGSDFHGFHFPAGASPGIEIPAVEWERFQEALGRAGKC